MMTTKMQASRSTASIVWTRKKWFDSIPNNNKIDTSSSTITTTTINYNSSTYDNNDNEDANTVQHSIHRTDKIIEWFESISNNNNNNSNSNTLPISTSITNIPTTNTNTNNNKDNNETFYLSFMFKLISLYLIITKSVSSTEFTKQTKEKQHHQQKQQHYHGKHRHQFHLEQQQKHQLFKQGYHNVERMAIFILLKLTLVAWDMWTYRNGF
jgi:hypothetical protein